MASPADDPGGGDDSEGGISILRADAETDRERLRYERSSVFARFGLIGLGAVTLGSGAGLVLAHYALVAFAILAFGLLLMILGAVQHLLFLRGRDRWPTQLVLFDTGVEVVLRNGDVRAAEWNDPKLALEVQTHPRSDGSGDAATLFWRMDRSIPPCAITADGFAKLQGEIVGRGLSMNDSRRGPRRQETRVLQIGPAPPKTVAKSAADWGP